MTSNEIQEVLINILKQQHEITQHQPYTEKITPKTILREIIQDSLDAVEVIMKLEKALSTDIDDELAESKFNLGSTIQEMTLALANLTNKKPEISQKPKTESIKQQPIIELYQLNQTTLQFRQDGKVLSLYDKKVQPYINMLRNELEKQTQK